MPGGQQGNLTKILSGSLEPHYIGIHLKGIFENVKVSNYVQEFGYGIRFFSHVQVEDDGESGAYGLTM